MQKSVPLLVLALLAISSRAEDPGNRLVFKNNGFSIEALDETGDAESRLVLQMVMPPSDNFTPNVTVMIQRHKGTVKQYSDMSKEQIKAAGWTVKREAVTPTGLIFEYEGPFGGRKMKWRARAEFKDGKVYLATCTATAAQWDAVQAKLNACVDSFKLEKG